MRDEVGVKEAAGEGNDGALSLVMVVECERVSARVTVDFICFFKKTIKFY